MTTLRPPLAGGEKLIGLKSCDSVTLLDFWRWGFSNLLFNNTRGIFGEWMVANLLGIELPPRDSWAEYDLLTATGIRIEVKTTAYLQAWNPQNPSKTPAFSGLKGRTWTLETGYAGTASYNADLYVFCLQIETDIARWNALDLTQWRFFILTREQLALRDSHSITLSALRNCTKELSADEFQREALMLIADHTPVSDHA